MACFMNLTVIVILSLLGCVIGQQNNAQVQNNDNSEQFALLCRIYNVAKNPPIHHVDLQDPNKIVEDIDSINAYFAEERRLNGTEESGNSSDPTLKPIITREAAVAQAILRRIAQKAHTILDEIRRVNATRDMEKVKSEFEQVIFGESGNESELCQGALSGVNIRADACGKSWLSNKGDSAGKNLVVDFFCLCAMRTSANGKDNDGISNVCGVEVGGKSKDDTHSWGDTCPPTSSTMWASIKKGCGRHMHQDMKLAEEGHEILKDFLQHLKSGGVYRWGSKSGIDGSGRMAGMLGTGAGTANRGNEKDILCNGGRGYTSTRGGTEPPGGVCVYYGPENEWKNILWLMKLKTALNKVEALNKKTATIQRAIQKIQMLLHRAEKIYETAKVITEIQNPVVLTAIQNATGNLTDHNATRTRSYSYISHPCLIPALALILL